MIVYFFSGDKYIQYTRGQTGPGSPATTTPQPISDWGWPKFNNGLPFAANGIDAALYSGSKCYFFSGKYWVSVTRNEPTGVISQDYHAPQPISAWGWHQGFGANGIDAALWSGPVCYFFKDNKYIRVTRGQTDFGNGGDPGYPMTIPNGWGWPAPFASKVKGAFPSGLKIYAFSGNEYIRVSRGLEIAGFIDTGYPAKNTAWGWPAGFGESGIDAALYSGGDLEPQPAGGLVSNFNYWLGDNGNNLTGVSVTVNVDNDLISVSDGFGFQLNTVSQVIPSVLSAAVQQIIIYSPRGTNQLVCEFFMYSSTGNANPLPIQISGKVTKSLATLPGTNHMPAGSSVNFNVQTDTRTSKITGCTFTYTTPTGKAFTNSITLSTDFTVNQTKQLATASYMQPINALTMNIVADYSTSVNPPYGTAKLTEGEGSISYSATSAPNGQLTATTGIPSYSNENLTDHTAESANLIYAALPGGRPVDVSQLWGITPPVPVDLAGSVVEQVVEPEPRKDISTLVHVVDEQELRDVIEKAGGTFSLVVQG
jgi:hypothetical protein